MSIKMNFSIVLLVTFAETCFGAPTTQEPAMTTESANVVTPITPNQKSVITNYLNMYRYSNTIEWDDSLASLAQTSAETCPTDSLSEQAETDEILIYLPSDFDVEIDTVRMFKSVEHSSNFVRLYTCNPTILRFGTADKVGCAHHTGCNDGNAYVCVFSPKGPSYCSL